MPTLVLALIAVYALFFWLIHRVVTGAEAERARGEDRAAAAREGTGSAP